MRSRYHKGKPEKASFSVITMKSISKILAILVFFTCLLVGINLRSHPCELQATSSEAISVQSKKRIYNKIFARPQACLPKKIVLGVPDNLKSETGEPINNKGNREAPKITTVINISDSSNRLFVGRIDRIGGQWYYTKYDTCLAWKWAIEDEQQALYLTLERNLEIYSPEIESIILVIALPFELIEKNPQIWVKPYTWNRLGGFYKLTSNNYRELSAMLRLVEEDKPEASEVFYPGKEVSPIIAKELNNIDKMGGVHYNKDLEQNIFPLDAKGYQFSEQSGYCAVPQDLVDPNDPNQCEIAPEK